MLFVNQRLDALQNILVVHRLHSFVTASWIASAKALESNHGAPGWDCQPIQAMQYAEGVAVNPSPQPAPSSPP